jgi:hypothetical protein
MISTSDADYIRTKEMLRGNAPIEPNIVKLMGWVRKKYDIDVINIEISISEIDGRDSLLVIVAHYDDKIKSECGSIGRWLGKWLGYYRVGCWLAPYGNTNPHVQQRIVEKYVEFFAVPTGLDAPHVHFANFYHVAIEEIRGESDLKAIRQKYKKEGVWKIIQGRVFYYTEEQKSNNRLNGVNKRITQDIFQKMKLHDEFGVLDEKRFIVLFESKQRLDERFQSSLQHYF